MQRVREKRLEEVRGNCDWWKIQHCAFFAVFKMWARAVLCAVLLSALCPAGKTEAERDEREVQDYHNSNRLVNPSVEYLQYLIF